MEVPGQLQSPPTSPKPQSNGHGSHNRAPPTSPATPGNDQHHNNKSSLTAAADLIRTLDTAFAEMSTLSASAARDAEDARRNARAASEVARRYTARSYPATPVFEEAESPNTGASGANDWNAAAAVRPSVEESHARGGEALLQLETNGYDEATNDNAAVTPSETAEGAGRKRKTYKITSSSERLAQSHAEDVLSLSLELERTKQALEAEQRKHDETRSALTEARCRHTQLEAQVQKLLNDMETQREDHGRQVDGLQLELRRASVRVEAAEEDAQLALELAKGNAESREQVEEWLQRALHEVQVLREVLERKGVDPTSVVPPPTSASPGSPENASGKKQNVRFASPLVLTDRLMFSDIPEEPELTPRSHASRPMVAAGRQLLQRAACSTPTDNSRCHSVSFTPEKSAERRRKLRERLRALDDDVQIPSPERGKREPVFESRVVHGGVDMGHAKKAIEASQNVAVCLTESGKRLGLSDHWVFHSPRGHFGTDFVETMARQYCYSVEAKIGKQNEQMKELEALCEYLERTQVTEKPHSLNQFVMEDGDVLED